MKAPGNIFENGRMKLMRALAALALCLTGCYDSNEQEGHKDPKQGEFSVTVTPPSVTLDAAHRSATVTVTGECRGGKIPNPCATVNWQVKRTNTVSGVTARFLGDTTQYSVTMEIAVDLDKVIADKSRNSLTGPQHGDIVFNPNLQGAALYTENLQYAGHWAVDVTVVVPGDQPPREEQSPDQPHLSVTKHRSFALAKNDDDLEQQLTVTYSGPPNTLTVGTPYNIGSVLKGADKFTVSTPRTITLDGGSEYQRIDVKFKVDKTDFNFYDALLDVTVENARPFSVILTGNRSQF